MQQSGPGRIFLEKRSAERTRTGPTNTLRAPSAVSSSESGRGEMDPGEDVLSRGTEKKNLPRVIACSAA